MPGQPPTEAIARTVAAIAPPDQAAAARAAERQGRLTKPPGSLGRLESLETRIAGITGVDRPRLKQRLLVVAAGDHGVAAQDVSAYPQSVTAQMVANFAAGGAAVNVLADHAGARVHVVDAGVAEETSAALGLTRLRLAPGTDDITVGPAMTRELAERAIVAGIELFEAEQAGEGVDIVGLGEMGIANSSSAAAIVAAVTGRPPRTVTGRGTGIDDQRFELKVAAIERALEVNRPDVTDGVALLASIGGFEVGVLAGVYLAAAATRVPAVVDGLISGAAALVAEAVEPTVRPYLIASHLSVEPGHTATLDHLGLEPLFDFGLRLGEGTGAALGITICVAACRLLDEMATFDEAGVDNSDDVVAPEA
ncbi:MAG TPA: nicotinate-nucleotide--dimethylbenzimidazole phosphoribosyltransferase [Dehalococcoidia bacterium]|jgi:nicotinate-nucleotide--dimethylbenzimidazole phosphoribosyltransferase|nr:nicotinate-nucleotide--dimethylbenzimidazole phosphoribosyltransferase [Dehalococcoidia bacterium]